MEGRTIMKSRTVFGIILILQAVLVIIQLYLKHDAWINMACYWFVVMLRDFSDVLDQGRSGHDRK